MKCDLCRDRTAVVFVQQVSKEGSLELHLCEICAKEQGFSTTDNKIDITLGGLFSNLFEKKIPIEINKVVSCQICGTTFAEIKKNGKVGCSTCYQQFRSEIISYMRSEGVDISYTGSLPEKLEIFNTSKTDPASLRKELQEAIEREDYELAAYYRDRLRMLGGNS